MSNSKEHPNWGKTTQELWSQLYKEVKKLSKGWEIQQLDLPGQPIVFIQPKTNKTHQDQYMEVVSRFKQQLAEDTELVTVKDVGLLVDYFLVEIVDQLAETQPLLQLVHHQTVTLQLTSNIFDPFVRLVWEKYSDEEFSEVIQDVLGVGSDSDSQKDYLDYRQSVQESQLKFSEEDKELIRELDTFHQYIITELEPYHLAWDVYDVSRRDNDELVQIIIDSKSTKLLKPKKEDAQGKGYDLYHHENVESIAWTFAYHLMNINDDTQIIINKDIESEVKGLFNTLTHYVRTNLDK